MRAHARAVARSVDGVTRFVTLRSDAPLLLRETPGALYLVGGAAGPLGGDDLTLDVDVGPGASVVLRSAAALLAQPGRDGTRSQQRTRMSVGSNGSLVVRAEPLVAVRGCHHLVDTTVELAETATVELVEELVLGRHGEAPGRVNGRVRVERAGVALLTHELDVGEGAPGWPSAGILGAARAVVQRIVVGTPRGDVVVLRDDAAATYAAWLPFAPGAAALLALGPSLLAARAAADALDRAPCPASARRIATASRPDVRRR